MRQHFMRVYVGIALVLLVGVGVTMFMVNRQFENIRNRSFTESMTEIVTGLRENLLQTQDPIERAEIIRQIPVPIQVIFRSLDQISLSQTQLKNLNAGQVIAIPKDMLPETYGVWDGKHNNLTLFYARLSKNEVMILGPKPPPQFDEFNGHKGPPKGGFGAKPKFRAPQKPPGPGDSRREPNRLFGIYSPDLILLGLLASVLVLIGLAIFFLIRPLEQRIYALTDVTKRFGEGDLTQRVTVDYADSITELGHTFNAMADRIKNLVDGHKELLRAVSHEFRTPLARLFFILDEAQEATTPQEKDAYLTRIQNSLNEMNELVEELLTYARLERDVLEPEFETVHVDVEMKTMPDMIMELRQDITIDVQCDVATIQAMPRYFKRALQNLITNAVRHTKTGIWLSGYVKDGMMHVVVEDDGNGIPKAQREQIFEPFARLDESRNAQLGGVGLGLAIIKRIVDLHNGIVTVDDSHHGGARFTLSFPM